MDRRRRNKCGRAGQSGICHYFVVSNSEEKRERTIWTLSNTVVVRTFLSFVQEECPDIFEVVSVSARDEVVFAVQEDVHFSSRQSFAHCMSVSPKKIFDLESLFRF